MPEEEQAASEPCLDEAKLRIVMSTLADMHLEGVPVAVTTGKKRRRYFDGNGREIGKDSALCTMGGLIWHVSPMMDPLRSSLRCCGRFISLQDAQSIVAGSKAGGAPTTAQELAGLHVPLRRYAVCRLTFMAVFLFTWIGRGIASGDGAIRIQISSRLSTAARGLRSPPGLPLDRRARRVC